MFLINVLIQRYYDATGWLFEVLFNVLRGCCTTNIVVEAGSSDFHRIMVYTDSLLKFMKLSNNSINVRKIHDCILLLHTETSYEQSPVDKYRSIHVYQMTIEGFTGCDFELNG